MLEQGLDAATQEALITNLRRHGPTARPLFFLTRSSAILDLNCLGVDEAIILCPANHSPPSRVIPCPGSPGYEAVATCLASPEVRARTEGMVAHLMVERNFSPSAVLQLIGKRTVFVATVGSRVVELQVLMAA